MLTGFSAPRGPQKIAAKAKAVHLVVANDWSQVPDSGLWNQKAWSGFIQGQHGAAQGIGLQESSQ